MPSMLDMMRGGPQGAGRTSALGAAPGQAGMMPGGPSSPLMGAAGGMGGSFGGQFGDSSPVLGGGGLGARGMTDAMAGAGTGSVSSPMGSPIASSSSSVAGPLPPRGGGLVSMLRRGPGRGGGL